MNKYLIESITEVFEECFTYGEGKFANQYSTDGRIKAKTPKEAVLSFIATNLYFTNGELYADQDGGVEISPPVYYTQVDNDNEEPSKSQKDAWERGEIVLYNSRTTFRVYLLTQQTF